jgi:hypothetical protein
MFEYDFLNAPCGVCGYNGAGYWQRRTHDRDCPWHYVGGAVERARAVRALLPRFKAATAAAANGQSPTTEK